MTSNILGGALDELHRQPSIGSYLFGTLILGCSAFVLSEIGVGVRFIVIAVVALVVPSQFLFHGCRRAFRSKRIRVLLERVLSKRGVSELACEIAELKHQLQQQQHEIAVLKDQIRKEDLY